MGVDFTAFLGHDFSMSGILGLPAQLGVLDPLIHLIENDPEYPRTPPVNPPYRWSWVVRGNANADDSAVLTEIERYGYAGLREENSFIFWIGSRSMYIHHWTRWHRFIADERETKLLRRLCGALAELVRSPIAIYMGDAAVSGFDLSEAVSRGAPIDETLRDLEKVVGPPAQTIRDLAEGKWWESYYVDRFGP